jgi:hypothetical protein
MPDDPRSPTAPGAACEQAIARYLHLLRTAPPAAIESVHTEAFRALTAAQRGALLERLRDLLPPAERALAVPVNGTPVGLARLITRAETRQPGTLARLFGSAAVGATGAAAGLLGAIAGAVAVSALAAPWLAQTAGALAAATMSAAVPQGGEAPEDRAEASVDPGETLGDDAVADAGSLDEADGDLGLDFGLDDLFDV